MNENGILELLCHIHDKPVKRLKIAKGFSINQTSGQFQNEFIRLIYKTKKKSHVCKSVCIESYILKNFASVLLAFSVLVTSGNIAGSHFSNLPIRSHPMFFLPHLMTKNGVPVNVFFFHLLQQVKVTRGYVQLIGRMQKHISASFDEILF